MQNINLHKAQFPPKASVEVSKKVSLVIIIICLSLIVAASLAFWKIKTLKDEYITFTKSSSLTQSAIDSIKSDLNASAKEDNLKIDLLNIKDKIKHKLALKVEIDKESVDIATSFYQRFVALSKRDINGIWLTKILFFDKGRELTLTGNAQNPELIAKYIKRLSKEPIFSGLTFESIHIDKPDKKKNGDFIRFIVSSDLLEMTIPLKDSLERTEK